MCRNQVEARMHQIGDGDLGAIVRSASQNSSQLLELGANFPFQAQMFRHSSSPASSMRLMDLISGTVVPVELQQMGHQGFSMGGMDPSSPSSGYGSRAPEGLIPVEKLEVKKEIEEGSMHEIFSSTRSLPPYNSFADDIKEGILHRDDLFNPCPPDVVPLFQNCARISPSDAIANQPWSSGDPKSELLPSPAKENPSNGPGSSSKQGSKRSRKMQQKRIVCVPMGGGGKPTGEVLPSDMWAWRKYGQKPIKGSPYPRGYYRCSSSKGCSARKQVERSRTDPSMLIITYTSEHNHPWPVHRNSLAGTTRIRPQLANSQDSNQTAQQDKPVPDSDKNCSGRENPFVSIINSSTSGLGESMVNENANDSKDVMSIDNISRSSSPEEDLFSELEELPELSTILEKGGFLEYKSDDEGSASRIVDAYHLFASWPHHPAPNPAAKNGAIKTEAAD